MAAPVTTTGGNFPFQETLMKTLGFSVRFVACALVLFVGAHPAAAQSAGDRARLDDLAREAARKFAAASPVAADQTRPSTPAPSPGATVDLTLDEVVNTATRFDGAGGVAQALQPGTLLGRERLKDG